MKERELMYVIFVVKTSARKSDLKKHIKTVHEGQRAHTCSVCDKSFTVNSSPTSSHKDCA